MSVPFKTAASGSMDEQEFRGRSSVERCVLRGPVLYSDREGSIIRERQASASEKELFEPRWFAVGDSSTEGEGEYQDEDQDDNTQTCPCKGPSKTAVSDPVDVKLSAYPPYLKAAGSLALGMMVKGSTCQYVMQLHEEGCSARKIAWKIARRVRTEMYSPDDIQAIIQSCVSSGLDGRSPLATAGWEREPIEGWWIKEESHCEALRKTIPVSEDVCGYACNEGWWKERQSEQNRDWEQFGERSIGSPSRKRDTSLV
jgi:predicted nucleic acid-binding Zn ribbon protein